jgi:hypothetical protein
MKLASLSVFRETQLESRLLKTASLSEEMLYQEMKKLAEYGSAEEIQVFLSAYLEMEKDAGIIGHGFRMLSKTLGKAGKYTGSSRLSDYAGRAAAKSQKAFQAGATKAQGKVVSMEEGFRSGSGGRLTRQMQKADNYSQLARQQGQYATRHADQAAIVRMRKANAAAQPKPTGVAAVDDAADGAAKGTGIGKTLLLGGAGLGTLAGAGMMKSKLDSMGQAQNQAMSQRGFNYGTR